MTKEVCEVTYINEDKVNRVKEKLEKENIVEVAEMFKALADDTRLKIAYALTVEDELCVCDVANIINSSTATASHHLRKLYHSGIAKSRKEGKLVYYSLDDDCVKDLIQTAFAHQKEGMHLG